MTLMRAYLTGLGELVALALFLAMLALWAGIMAHAI